MERKRFSVLFFIKRSKLLKNGEAPVRVRVTYDRLYVELQLKRSVKVPLWSQDKEKSIGKDRNSVELNHYIDALQSTMNNPFEEIFKRLENIEKMISPVGSSSSEEPDSRQSVLVKISVASRITGYSVNYLYHLASSGAIPYVKRGRSLRFDVNELQQWMQQQYIPASNKLSDERKKE